MSLLQYFGCTPLIFSAEEVAPQTSLCWHAGCSLIYVSCHLIYVSCQFVGMLVSLILLWHACMMRMNLPICILFWGCFLGQPLLGTFGLFMKFFRSCALCTQTSGIFGVVLSTCCPSLTEDWSLLQTSEK